VANFSTDLSVDAYVLAIAMLLPITACMLVTQVNPYHALVIRGILGAVAALVYALFGAADVALTEALVGTMLSITLYAIAVRSSLRMRLGVLEEALPERSPVADYPQPLPAATPVLSALRQALRQYHMRLELVAYPDPQALQAALVTKDVHTILLPSATAIAASQPPDSLTGHSSGQPLGQSSGQSSGQHSGHPSRSHTPPRRYQLQTRIQRLYEILQPVLPSDVASLDYLTLKSNPQTHLPHDPSAAVEPPPSMEVQS
jgi:putative multicomponent Na+:H+ antiporter subunit B